MNNLYFNRNAIREILNITPQNLYYHLRKVSKPDTVQFFADPSNHRTVRQAFFSGANVAEIASGIHNVSSDIFMRRYGNMVLAQGEPGDTCYPIRSYADFAAALEYINRFDL